MAIFEPKPWVHPCGKILILSTFSTSGFYSLERAFFALDYPKRHFPGLYCLKKKVEKLAIFGPKPWVNPTSSPGLFPQKMGGAGKGPGIGWSRAKPKYS